MAGAMERAHSAAWRRSPLAATRRCRLFLHEHIRTRRVASINLDVRFGDLARLSLLLWSCDVGHRELLGAAAHSSAAGSRRSVIGISVEKPGRCASQCAGLWPPRAAVSLGIRAYKRRGGITIAWHGRMA